MHPKPDDKNILGLKIDIKKSGWIMKSNDALSQHGQLWQEKSNMNLTKM